MSNHSQDNFGVAHAKLACSICLKEADSVILMNQRLNTYNKKEVENLHNKFIGFTDKPCKHCQEMLENYSILIEVDLSKTEDKSNPHRTGNIMYVRQGIFEHTVMFIDIKDSLELQSKFNLVEEKKELAND